MTRELKHPRDFGFEYGFKVVVGAQGRGCAEIVQPSEAARSKMDVVYIALVEGSDKALKVGQTRGTAFRRWTDTLKVMNRLVGDIKLKPNELSDGDKLLKHTTGRGFTVWIKSPERVAIPYAPEAGMFSMRSAEEDFLDCYFEPLVGQPLSARKAKRLGSAGADLREDEPEGWSEDLKLATIKILRDPGKVRLRDERLHMKNNNGALGLMHSDDLLAQRAVIVDKQTGSKTTFSNARELIEAGWVLD